MESKKSTRILGLFTISVFFIVISPMWLSQGMFLDGLYYAAIAHNFSVGTGSFWHLCFSTYQDSYFVGHPPLVLWIESFLYKIFGDSIYVEKLYSVLTYFFSGAVVFLIWKEIFGDKGKKYYWFVILLWLMFPLTGWGAVNNMLENTMTIFLLLSIYFGLKDINTKKIVYTILSGFFVFLAFMSKGPVGLFPLSMYFWYWLIKRDVDFKFMFFRTLVQFLVPLIIFLMILITNNSALVVFDSYFHKQIIVSLMGRGSKLNGQNLIVALMQEFIPVFLFIIFLRLILRKRFRDFEIDYRLALFFCLLALSGIIPISFGRKQRVFYSLPVLPIFSIGIGIFLYPYFEVLEKKVVSRKWFRHLSYVLFLLAIVSNVYFFNKPMRDEQFIYDAKKVVEVTKSDDLINLSYKLWGNYIFQAYLARYGRLNFCYKKNAKYFLTEKKEKKKGYKLLDTIHLRGMYIYKIKN